MVWWGLQMCMNLWLNSITRKNYFPWCWFFFPVVLLLLVSRGKYFSVEQCWKINTLLPSKTKKKCEYCSLFTKSPVVFHCQSCFKWGNSVERFDKILKYNLFYPFTRFLSTTKFYTISLRQSAFQPFSNVYKQNTKIQPNRSTGI